VSKNDIVVPPAKEAILAELRGAGPASSRPIRHGLITERSGTSSITTIWTEATDAVAARWRRTSAS
jgi:hypothetical protein